MGEALILLVVLVGTSPAAVERWKQRRRRPRSFRQIAKLNHEIEGRDLRGRWT